MHNSGSFQKLCTLPPAKLGSYHHHVDLDSSTWLSMLGMSKIDQMLFCHNYNGGYHLFCLKLKLTQFPTDSWYCSSCSPTTPWLYPNHAMFFPTQVWGGDIWKFHLKLLLCIVYIGSCIYFWLISFYFLLVLVYLFNKF
jgi:hypothetical protein